MNKLLKLLKAIFAKGFATSAEKAQVQAYYKELDQDSKETVQEDVEKVENLSEADPKDGSDADIQKQVRDLVKAGIEAGTASVREMFEAFTKQTKDDVQTFLKEQATLREKKVGIYHPEVQEKRKNVNDYLRKFMNAQFDNDVETIKALNGGMSMKELTTDATGSPYGGYVVDRELSAEIRHLLAEYGSARREFFTMQLSKNSYTANTLATDVSVFWVDEAAAIKSSQIVLGKGDLTLKKLAVIVALTRELLEDEEIDLFAFIGDRVAQGFAKAEDLAFWDGDGSGTYGGFTGLLRNASVNTKTLAIASTFSSLTADDLLDMQDLTPTEALPNGKYYMHRTILSVVRKLKDSTGNYIYQAPGQGLPATIWNKPVVLVEAFPAVSATAASKAFVLFGDVKKAAILGYKGAISADRFNAGVVRNVADNADINLITTDREAIRWVERVGMLALLPTAVTRLRTGAAS